MRSPHLEALRKLAAAGVHAAEAARRLDITEQAVSQLRRRHAIAFAAPPREGFRIAGRASAASPHHHRFTAADKARSAATQRGRCKRAKPLWQIAGKQRGWWPPARREPGAAEPARER